MWTKRLSLLLVFLFTINITIHVSSVTARSILGFKKDLKERAINPDRRAVNIGVHLTNAERIIKGLSPHRPIVKPNRVYNATARRSMSVFIPMSGKILVKSVKDSKVLGYISPTLNNGMYTITKDEDTADEFTTYAHSYGVTSSLNFKDRSNPNAYLGGVIQPGDHIGSSSNKVAKLVPAGATRRGDTPQPSRSSAISGNVETAIWSYDSETQELSARWVNEGEGLEHTVPTTILARKDRKGKYFFMLARKLSEDDEDAEEDAEDGSGEEDDVGDEDDSVIGTRDDSDDGEGDSKGSLDDAHDNTFDDSDTVVALMFIRGQDNEHRP